MARDGSGNGNYGAIRGSRWAAGRHGKALSFDGRDDWVTVLDSPSLDLSTAMTVEAWVRPRSVSGWRTILEKETDTELSFGLYAASAGGAPSGWGGMRGIYGPARIPTGTWTHLAATHDGVRLRLFRDGKLVASRPMQARLKVSGRELRIGGNAVWGEFFSGLIDEVRVYSRALSAAEIERDRNTPVPDAAPSSARRPAGAVKQRPRSRSQARARAKHGPPRRTRPRR